MKLKAYKFRLKPNKDQATLINKTIGCARLIYNCMLYERQEDYKNQTNNKNFKTEKQYKKEYAFLKEVDSVALQQARIDVYNAYQNFFRKIQKGKKTSLKYKSKKNVKNSYRTVAYRNNIRTENLKIKLPKLGLVSFFKSREIKGKIKSVTITKNILNQYFISVLTEQEIKYKKKQKKEIGIDLGLKEFLIDSDGNKTSNPKYYRKLENKLVKVQRTLSRRKKNSNRYFKQRQKTFKIHQKIRNLRNDFLHKLSTKLINENQVIYLEDLNVKGMVKNKKLSKSISDVSWSEFVRMLKYKAEWYGREIIQIDQFFPSSKTCHSCGNKNDMLTLKDREWICIGCGTHHDRDINAALNILSEGKNVRKKLNRRDDGNSSVNKSSLELCS